MLFFAMLDINESSTLEAIYHEHGRQLINIAYGILNDQHESQDAVQQSFEKLMKSRKRIDLTDYGRVLGYLRIVVRNQAIDLYNLKKRVSYTEPEKIIDLDMIDDFEIDKDLLQFEKSKEFALKLDKINPRYSAVITLKYYLELENNEIATALDCTESNVRVLLYRAKKSLRNLLLSEVS